MSNYLQKISSNTFINKKGSSINQKVVDQETLTLNEWFYLYIFKFDQEFLKVQDFSINIIDYLK